MRLSDDARALWDTALNLRAEALIAREGCVSRNDTRLPPLLFFTDPARTPRPWETASNLPEGAGVVFRHFGRPDARTAALRLRRVTAERGQVLLIGLDADLAGDVGADGLHLPERSLSAAYALSGRHPGWLLTGAVHSLDATRTARDLDAVVLSPIFEAGGPSSGKTPLGIETLSMAAHQATCPVYALGGITAETAALLVGSGACGIAGVDAVASAFSSPRI